ncbi:hypothetical protein [Phytohabitans aurantiacus]|uniref:Ig-like domain-containing protein n=1 Tax=Phytohabitans aurantiacus TaxID=3016789 RepID=A0ABQ5QP22_9ACTN|nr:hypothetical protein [Phytohabitans aurantiacus]GLH96401.1 hypothetical protein Pa4123_16750 [Phytohabitans aurantiacus]
MRRFGTALAAILLTLLAATPAAATELPWERLSCTAGSLDTIETGTTNGIHFLTLAGHLDCADPAGTGATFGFASYRGGDNGWAPQSTMGRYAPVPPTPFSMQKTVRPGQPTFGICVVTDKVVRVACVEVAWDPAQQIAVARPLPTKHPLVNVSATVYDGPGNASTSPACGTCW